MNSIDLFVKNWGSKQAMSPIASADISALETRLTVTLPESYKYLLAHYGLVHSPNVLTKICDLGVDIAEVQDFLSLEDVDSLSKLYEMTGMPKGHILFASDCKGNMFCFKLSDCGTSNKDVPVWFYNHDLRTVSQVADTFSAWLDRFNTL
ncbi:MAG: SMI1/KNR4 family protein [Cognaticolwellia sp.]